jgi:large subunit ribosomal protein L20
MPRSQNSVASRNKRKKILKQAKGYYGRRKNVWRVAKNAVEKGLLYSYRDRKNKKRSFRLLWIIRINAAAKLNGSSYSKLISNLKSKKVNLDRKVLSDIAMNNPDTFSKIVNKVK